MMLFIIFKAKSWPKLRLQESESIDLDKECWEEMRIINAYRWQKNDTILLVLFAARFLLSIYEKKCPDDSRPRQALEAAEAYHACPCPQHQLAITSASEGSLRQPPAGHSMSGGSKPRWQHLAFLMLLWLS